MKLILIDLIEKQIPVAADRVSEKIKTSIWPEDKKMIIYEINFDRFNRKTDTGGCW